MVLVAGQFLVHANFGYLPEIHTPDELRDVVNFHC